MMVITKSKETKEEIINARCSAYAKKILDILSQSENLSKSEIIVKSILEYHENHFTNKSLPEVEKELFGKYGSGKGNLSVKRKQYLKEILDGKHSHS